MLVKSSWPPKIIFALYLALCLIFVLPFEVQAEMSNNLSNAGCKSCHVDYPGIISGTSQTYTHKITNCTNCHIGGPVIEKMWNCRYCHLTTYYDTYPLSLAGYPDWTGTVSGFKSWRDPLRGAVLGSETRWMGAHFTGGSSIYLPPNFWPVDANFDYHNNSSGYQHKVSFGDPQCLGCHKDTLTAEHESKTKVNKEPKEDFEDGNFTFNFTGYWGGDWSRTAESTHTGGYAFKSGLIGTGLRDAPYSVAVTEASVEVQTAGTVSFWYKVSGTGTQLNFAVDGNNVLTNSSSVWSEFSYPLGAGAHTLQWSTGGNSAYIDDITLTGAKTTYKVDCNTCHLSSADNVKNAINSHNTTCTSCHPEHVTPHATGLDEKCQSCHKSNTYEEHLTNTNTQTQPKDCASCHQNLDLNVTRAIADKEICVACHNKGHNLSFARPIPTDIPFYSGFTWTSPIEATLWAGEKWLPDNIPGAAVVLSSRRQDVSSQDIRTYYIDTMLINGWTQENVTEYDNGGFRILFSKAGRQVYIFWYSGQTPGTSSSVNIGSRILIIFK